MLSRARLLPLRFDAYRNGTDVAEDFQCASQLIEKSDCIPRRSHGVGCLYLLTYLTVGIASFPGRPQWRRLVDDGSQNYFSEDWKSNNKKQEST
jgi:hypothetical protein